MADRFETAPPSYGTSDSRADHSHRILLQAKQRTSRFHPLRTIEGQMYTIPQQQQPETMKYSTVNPTVPIAYGVQVVPVITLGRSPVHCTCANCRSTIITRVQYTNGLLAWLVCFLLFIFGCWLGCCLIPFCVSDLQNIQHYCPNCNAFIGEFQLPLDLSDSK